MTLRGVIQGLLRGTNDAEAMLAEEGFDDLPADMFGQALASYADTAPIAEADALTPILASLEAGDPSDVFAVLDEQPLDLDGPGAGDLTALASSLAGVTALTGDAHDDGADDGASDVADDTPDFGGVAGGDDADAESVDTVDDSESIDGFDDDSIDSQHSAGQDTTLDLGDPFDDPLVDTTAESPNETDTFEEYFDSEPEATGDDPSDLDLDF